MGGIINCAMHGIRYLAVLFPTVRETFPLARLFMTLSRAEQRQAKQAFLDYAWNLYEYPETNSDLTDDQRLYIKELIFRAAQLFGVNKF